MAMIRICQQHHHLKSTNWRKKYIYGNIDDVSFWGEKKIVNKLPQNTCFDASWKDIGISGNKSRSEEKEKNKKQIQPIT